MIELFVLPLQTTNGKISYSDNIGICVKIYAYIYMYLFEILVVSNILAKNGQLQIGKQNIIQIFLQQCMYKYTVAVYQFFLFSWTLHNLE